MDIIVPIEKFISALFDPVVNLLTSTLQRLDTFSLQPARYLKLDYFLGPISMLGPNWRTLIASIIGCLTLIIVVFLVKATYNLYLNFKNGIQWW